MPKNNWHVITGGPSSGKTTLITELERLGYRTLPEVARTVIDEGMALGKRVEEIRKDEKEFQYKVLQRKLDIEKKLDKKELIFFDRGMHDSHAYLDYYKFEINELAEIAKHEAKYATVFLLAPLKFFEKDYARTEDENFAKKITNLLKRAYVEAGMEPVWVPYMPPKKRAKFVLKHMNSEEKAE
jgi:predicted ATPase